MRFHADVDGGEAECVYRLAGSLMNIVHTEVPPQAEGRASPPRWCAPRWPMRARWAGACGRRAATWRSYMRRHPDTQDLLE